MSGLRLLGSGMAAQAGNALASRQEQINAAVAAAEGGVPPQQPPQGANLFFTAPRRTPEMVLRQQRALAEALRRRDADLAAQGIPPARP